MNASEVLLIANITLASMNVSVSAYSGLRAPIFRIPFTLSALSSITLVLLNAYQLYLGTFTPSLLTRTGITVSLIFSLGVAISMAILVRELHITGLVGRGSELIVLIAPTDSDLTELVELTVEKCVNHDMEKLEQPA